MRLGRGEQDPTAPNSDYAVSKVATANLIYYYGKRKQFPCANLRLYSVFGPLEDSSRLIPNLIRRGLEAGYPDFVNPAVSRDFIYVDDVTEAFVDTALNLTSADYGESFNIGTGRKTTIGEVAAMARKLFNIPAEPAFTMPERQWDVQDWYANIDKARQHLGWEPRTTFERGPPGRPSTGTGRLPDKQRYEQSSKKYGLDTVYSVSAIVACYKDNLAIPIMYERLKATFTKLNIDFEIIFVNDCSPDDSEEVIRGISRNDRRVVGISHSRNFGSQSAFRSGMEIATKNACVLLDGDLQDPPELIEKFVELWRAGLRRGLRTSGQTRGDPVHAVRLQGVLPRVRLFLVHRDPARRRRFFPHGQAGGQGDPPVPRARPVPARRPGLRRVQADRSRLRPARADVRPQHQQPAQEPRTGPRRGSSASATRR